MRVSLESATGSPLARIEPFGDKLAMRRWGFRFSKNVVDYDLINISDYNLINIFLELLDGEARLFFKNNPVKCHSFRANEILFRLLKNRKNGETESS